MKFVTGGYFIVTPKKRPDYMDKNLIPVQLLSASKCLTDFYEEMEKLVEDQLIGIGLPEEFVEDFIE